MEGKWEESLIELIRKTSTQLPDDVRQAINQAAKQEEPGSLSKSTFQIIQQNIELAWKHSRPICQDTGSILFYIDAPADFDWLGFQQAAQNAVRQATQLGYLRPNSVDPITGKNPGTNLGPGSPTFHLNPKPEGPIEVRLTLKGGGCENVGIQYALPYASLKADRDLEGCRRVILHAVYQAQGKGCSPGVLGVCIGGDRATGYEHSKKQFLRKLDDRNPIPELDHLEQQILQQANQLGIGPMGLGGKTTLLGVKIGCLNRHPASFFVTVSYMCWAYRRQGARFHPNGQIEEWLY